jgi:hypothetical protein
LAAIQQSVYLGELLMSIEFLLDLLVSVLFLAIYHADLAPAESQLEFCIVTGSPDGYDLSGPTIVAEPEWVLGGDPIACIPDSLITRPTVKQYRSAAKLLGVKNASRMSKAVLEAAVYDGMIEATLSELPIGDVTLDLNMDGFSIV